MVDLNMVCGLKRFLIGFFILISSGCFFHEYKEKSIDPIEIGPGVVFRTITDLPGILPESSGLGIADSIHFYSINDSKGKAALYVFDTLKELTRTIKIKDAENIDWEDLAQDENGNIYIGDMGNNDNDRKDLKIYKIPSPTTFLEDEIKAEAITFSYENQTKFPPADSAAFFDSEAIFIFNDSIFLFVKDRSKPFEGKTLMYQMPAEMGDHTAVLKGEFKTLNKKREGAITGADISPSGLKVALISNKNIWIFTNFSGTNFFEGDVNMISFPVDYQIEGIVFVNDCLIYLTNEKDGGNFSALHQLRICD